MASQVAAAISLQVSVVLARRATPSTIYSTARLSTPDFLEAQSCDDWTCQHRTMSTSRRSPSNDVEKLTLDERRRQRLEQQTYIRLCATPPYLYPRQTVFLASNIRVYQILRGRFFLQVVLSKHQFHVCLTRSQRRCHSLQCSHAPRVSHIHANYMS